MQPEDVMKRAIALALGSARSGGGPFGAVVATKDGKIVGEGWNRVLELHDSTAHAEIVAMRDAQRRLGAHRLDGLVLYTSCAPCIQCFGAIYWSGLAKVYSAGRKEDAEAIGFEEGPPMDELWKHALEEKGIEHEALFGLDDAALEPLREYAARGGVNYSRE